MENGKIVVEETNEGIRISVNGTGAEIIFLLATLITECLCKKFKISPLTFVSELAIKCIAMDEAKKDVENE